MVPKETKRKRYEQRTNAELRTMFDEPGLLGLLKSERISL